MTTAIVPLAAPLARDLSRALVEIVQAKEETRRVARRAELEVGLAKELRGLITGLARERTARVDALLKALPHVEPALQHRLVDLLERTLAGEAEDLARLVSRARQSRLTAGLEVE